MKRLIVFILTMLILFSCGQPITETNMQTGKNRIKISAYQLISRRGVFILDIDGREYIYSPEGCITPMKY